MTIAFDLVCATTFQANWRSVQHVGVHRSFRYRLPIVRHLPRDGQAYPVTALGDEATLNTAQIQIAVIWGTER